MNTSITAISKYFSYLLRHHPEAIGLTLDEQGWASIDELIAKTRDFVLTHELINIVVETNDKQRFSISADGQKIRANQGHSIDVDLALSPMQPPDILLHGTAEKFIASIMRDGLSRQQRHHVHLTESRAVAQAVGSRFGKAVILVIAARRMQVDGYVFFKTANNVWLVDHVPVSYIAQS